jgi:glycine/D-amino acid oxidase-like deaminating enzyme
MQPGSIAILGGGLMGCCAALALAEHGRRVVLFDRRSAPLLEASRNTEAKLHIGFVYAVDASLRTARMMQRGAVSFRPLVERWLGGTTLDPLRARPFVYAVLPDSQLPVEAIAAHLGKVRDMWTGDAEEAAFRRLSAGEVAALYDPEHVQAAFQTGEIALDAHRLAQLLADAVRAEPRIEFVGGFDVAAVERSGSTFRIRGNQARSEGPFAQVVNCLWANRVAVAIASGLPPPAPALTRYKLGVRLRPGPERLRGLASTTFVLGPYGDIVAWPDGSLYLSWYPAGMVASTLDTAPTDWRSLRAGVDAAAIAEATIAGLARLCPALPGTVAGLEPEVDGGAIYALGNTDIDDPRSRLHERSEIGAVATRPGYHSIDTGKYTMAPLFAAELAARIVGADTAGVA